MATPWFDDYLEHITEGIDFLKEFIRIYLYIVVHGVSKSHHFLYIHGPSGTGKSTLATLAHALVGDQATHTTSLSALKNDPFEAVNLEDKILVITGDKDDYNKEMMGPLKALTGGDPIRGRVMFSNVTRDFYFRGNVIMIGSQPP